jgi:hypothetical protein
LIPLQRKQKKTGQVPVFFCFPEVMTATKVPAAVADSPD